MYTAYASVTAQANRYSGSSLLPGRPLSPPPPPSSLAVPWFRINSLLPMRHSCSSSNALVAPPSTSYGSTRGFGYSRGILQTVIGFVALGSVSRRSSSTSHATRRRLHLSLSTASTSRGEAWPNGVKRVTLARIGGSPF